MKFWPLALLSTLLVIGCSQAPGSDESSLPPEGSQASAPGTGGGTDMGAGGTGGSSGGSSGSVQIHTGGAGGIAPVTGTENLGGGVQQAAKKKALDTAAGGGASSLDQLGDE